MAFDSYGESEDEGKISKFNAAFFQMRRIGELQSRINFVSLNPLAHNEEFGVYNYNVWVTCIDSLLQEVLPKLGPKEKEKIKEIRELVHTFLNKRPIIVEKKSVNSRGRVQVHLDNEVWETAYKMLNIYEEEVRDLLDTHQMQSPTRDPSGL